MHLVRNAVDHGIEAPERRAAAGKARTGTVTLEAQNAGSDVIVNRTGRRKRLEKAKY
jgi:two-component system chemotaxis sensor kinase CheA